MSQQVVNSEAEHRYLWPNKSGLSSNLKVFPWGGMPLTPLASMCLHTYYHGLTTSKMLLVLLHTANYSIQCQEHFNCRALTVCVPFI